MPTLSLVIPVYRAEGTLRELHRRIVAALEAGGEAFEVIFVEDCGGDRSWEVIQELAAGDARVRGLRMSRNYGQHAALLAGIRAARHEVVVTLDDDLQNPPEEIHKLVAKLAEGHDMVYGTRGQEMNGFLRDMASRVTKWALQSAMGAQTARNVSPMRAFPTALREAFAAYRSPTVNLDVLLTWATTRFGAVEVRHDPRTIGESGYTVRKLIAHALNLMTGFSTRPLQIASIMGFLFALFGFLVLGYVLVRFLLSGSSVPGFPFLASIIAIFSGVQLFALGIIGEYLARMHFRTMDRPPYLVREEIGTTEKDHI